MSRLRIQFLPFVGVCVDGDVARRGGVREGQALPIGKVLEVLEAQWRKDHLAVLDGRPLQEEREHEHEPKTKNEPTMKVRAKFKVDAVQKNEDGSGAVRLSPVVGGSAENEAFYKWTPGGHVELSTVNADALSQFEEGKEYYVDFTAAGDEEAAGEGTGAGQAGGEGAAPSQAELGQQQEQQLAA